MESIVIYSGQRATSYNRYVCMYACTTVYMYACMRVCVYACMRACVHACIY